MSKKIDQQLLIKVDKLIDTDLEKASKLLSDIDYFFKTDSYVAELKYLRGKLKDYYMYNKLDNEQKNIFHESIRLGNNSLIMKKYGEAIDYYFLGKKLTGHPVFKYYTGKAFYQKGRYDTAYYYLNKYSTSGGLMLLCAQKYLKSICLLEEKYEKAYDIENIINKINNTFNKETQTPGKIYLKK